MFDVYVINLDRNNNKWNKLNKTLNKYNIIPTRISAVDGYLLEDNNINNDKTVLFKLFGNSRLEAIYTSHKKTWNIINKKKSKNKYSIILEDDAVPIKNFDKELKKIFKYLPKEWDLILLGCIGCCNENNKCNNILDKFTKLFINNRKYRNKKKIKNKYLYEPLVFSGAHSYLINNNSINKIINTMTKINYHIDISLSNNQYLIKYATKKKIFNQDPTYSSYKNNRLDILNNIIIDKENKASLNWYLNMPLFNIGKIKITLFVLFIINFIILLLIIKKNNYKLIILLLLFNFIILLLIISLVWIKV